jgi:hypothetical protein
MTITTTTPAAQIGDTAWYLVKILHTEGVCDHCGRQLKHLYEVVNPDGKELTVGRGCVKRITGWTLSAARAEQALRSAKRVAEVSRRQAIVGAEYPELAAARDKLDAAGAQCRAEGFDVMTAYSRVSRKVCTDAAIFNTACLENHLWWNDEWREFLARSV